MELNFIIVFLTFIIPPSLWRPPGELFLKTWIACRFSPQAQAATCLEQTVFYEWLIDKCPYKAAKDKRNKPILECLWSLGIIEE